ncbi:hypothetical protein OYT1_ch1831 [Ferriphaselus amnicola]|uniref:Uncharacterized protein n=1 Tax=Ferriphaselus amnicola TaxID=1188319 RepID=A0A2Z6GDF1_9PROT|nr:hypothetical protein OYT1_ch1831 [Ferriphaselus amnicola]
MAISPISRVFFIVALLLFIMLGTLWMVTARPWQSNEQILEYFYSATASEEELMDPLILRGEEIVPMVISNVMRPDMPRRRYGIAFLGNGSYVTALPTLRSITEGEEPDYIRADALEAIYRIDQQVGLSYARLYADREDWLGNVARQVIKEPSSIGSHRSYIEALLGLTSG